MKDYKQAMIDHAVAMVARGMPASTAYIVAADGARKNLLLDLSLCPKCGCPLTRMVDARQVGMPETPGQWFNYRHTSVTPGVIYSPVSAATMKCDYMIDRKEVSHDQV